MSSSATITQTFWTALDCFGLLWTVLDCFGLLWTAINSFSKVSARSKPCTLPQVVPAVVPAESSTTQQGTKPNHLARLIAPVLFVGRPRNHRAPGSFLETTVRASICQHLRCSCSFWLSYRRHCSKPSGSTKDCRAPKVAACESCTLYL